ncbi:ImmA/IrrE family metallo-endopeptidase [Bacillus sp. FSL K6-3431]|uniref:ImmA/IrrE family metallo-endopeptidase n=1 Tax=Bacillus sp. FSL K6-3431 TaxID=2921500 RepID=UPI0030F93A5F
MMRTKPNYDKAKRAAYDALEYHRISDFPIDILTILESYDDIKIISYSEMAKKRGCTIEEIIAVNSSEDGVIHYSGNRGKYFIAYNDAIGHKERVYWTLAHEYGHYLLGHHKESSKSSLARNEMVDAEYDVQEVEANFFARFFLSPPPIIVEAKMNDHKKIMDFFGVSFTAASNTLKYIEDSYKKGFRFNTPIKIAKYINKFISKVQLGKTCRNCSGFSYIRNAEHCGICGSNDFHNIYKGEDIDMIYVGINVNENGKALECPVCENEETHIEGEHCGQCGTFIINLCSIELDGWNDDRYRPCPDPLPGNLRHCTKCGAESTFLKTGILKPWTQEKEDIKEFNKLFLA